MKHTSKLVAAFAALVCLSTSALAQVTATAGSDLILGFRATGGTGQSTNLEINLGAISGYVSGASAGTVSALINADLVSVYGANWNTRTDLFFGIAGYTGGVNKTLYTGAIETSAGTQSTFSYTVQNQNARNSAGVAISSAIGGFSSLTSLSSAAGSITASDGSSWTTFADPGSGVSFGFFDTSAFENSTNIASGSYAVTDLWKIATTGTASYIGSFGLSSSGVLTFSTSASTFATSAVPEPSTYAAFAGVCALALATVYRRRQSAKVVAA